MARRRKRPIGRLRSRLPVPVALAVLLAACGGDSDGSDPAATAELEAAAAEADEPAEADEAEDEASDPVEDEPGDEQTDDAEDEPEPLPPSSSGEVAITLGEWFITAAPASSVVGELRLSVDNEGGSSHEIIVVPTGEPPEDLPLDAKGDVDEGADGTVFLEHSSVSPEAAPSRGPSPWSRAGTT